MKQNTSLNRLYCSYGPACFVALALLSAAPSARATTRTWSVGSGNWSTPSNWSPTGAPQNNDNLVFNNSPGSNLTNDISSLIVGTVLFNHSGTVWGSGFMVTTNITVSIGLIENGTVTLSSALTLGNTVVSFILGNGLNKHGDLIVNDQITGAAPNLRKGGPGKMSLMTDNAYTGVTLLQQGTIYVRSNKALSSAGVVISDGATLEVDGGFFPTLANAIEMVGAGAGGIGALYIIGGEVSLAVLTGSIQLDAATTVNVDLGSELDLNGAICGPGSLTKIGAGTLSLGGSANNYLGITTVSEGMLELESLNAISVPGDVVIGENIVAGTNHATLLALDGQPLNPAANITVQSSGLFDVAGTNHLLTVGTLAGAGNVNLGSGSSLTVSNNADCVFGGVISGAGGFNKSGPALMQLAGTNHYTGITTILGGTLQAAGNAISVPGDVVIGENIVAGTNHATLLALDGQPLNPAANITVQSSGLFDVAGTNHLLTVGTLAGAGNVNLGSGSSLTVSNNADCVFGGVISGAGGFNKSGPALMQLAGTNHYTGITTILGGTLQAAGNAISVPGDVVIGENIVAGTNHATLLALDGQPLNPAANITVQSSGLFDVAGTNHLLTVGTLAGAGNVNLGSGTSLTVSNNADCVFGGVISGAGGFNKSGPALMQLAGTNHYTGITTILGGTLQAAGNAISVPGDVVIGENIVAGTNHATLLALDGQPLNPAANITVQSSGLFDVAGTNHLLTVGTLAGAGNVNLGSGSSLTVNGWFPCPSPFPLCPPFNGQISGSGTFIKSGPGTLLLTGNNALTGPTIVNAGVLQVDGSQPQSLVQVNGGRLQGSGTVGEIDFMASSAVVAPGDSPGILTCSNVAPVGSGNQSRGSLEIELNGTTPGTGYDQLNVHGTVTLNSRISLNASLNFPSSLNNTFTIINNTGSNAVAGTFSGLAQGATLAIGSQQFQISYTGGDGNDVVLTQISGAPLPTLSLAAVTPGAIALSWPTTGPAFTLQSSTNLSSSNWTAVSPGPVIVGANYVVTNATTDAQKFYRLIR